MGKEILCELWEKDWAKCKLKTLSGTSNYILDEIENNPEYDADSSPIAWKYYGKMYEFVCDRVEVGIKDKRIIGTFQYTQKK